MLAICSVRPALPHHERKRTRLRKIDLKRLDFNADKIKTIKMYKDREIVIDVTDHGK